MLSLPGPFLMVFAVQFLLMVFAVQFFSCSSIPVEEFIGYPFRSESSNHQILPSNDDSYVLVEIAEPIVVNGIPHRTVYINNNGVLNFQVFTTTWQPQAFPILGNDHIAPLWTDLDSRLCPQLVNTVFYKEFAGKDSTSLPVFNKIDSMVETVTRCANISFTTTWAFAVTWEEVRYYNLTGACDKYNTFQVVLATDGVVTFAIINYARVDTGDRHAMVGVNAGDGINFYAHPNSMKTDIYNIESEPGNTGELGQWVYRVDVISEETDYSRKILSQDGRIHLKPGVGTVFGGTPVVVDGPCVRDPENITCSFADQTEDGLYLGNGQFLCVTPEFTDHKVGRIPFILSFSSYGEHVTHKSNFHKIIRDPEKKMSLSTSTSFVTGEGKIEVTWDPEFLPLKDPQDYKVDIKLFKLDIAHSSRPLQYIQTLLHNVPNSGSAEVKIPMLKPTRDIVLFVKVVIVQSRGKRQPGKTIESNATTKPSLLADLFMREFMIFSCDEWTQAEPDGGDLLNFVTRCPQTQIQASQLNSNFHQVNFNNTSCFQDWDKHYNYPIAEVCFQQRTLLRRGITAGNMCCYVSGILCTRRQCAGTVDNISPAYAATQGDSILKVCLKHLRQDVLPRMYNCSGYYEKRPIDDGPPLPIEIPPAFAMTDPHIDTLDGHKYTFNGKGEFTLVEARNSEFVLQGRMVAYINTIDGKESGTVFSAIAAKSSNSDTVQVELNSNGVLITLVNGEAVSFEDINSLDFRNVTVKDMGNSTVSATFACGAYIEVKEDNDIISVVFVSLSKEFRGLTHGLMGNFNGNVSDDLMPNGSDVPISLNSSLKTIHEQFGMTWIIENGAKSIFTYNAMTNWTHYYDPGYTPLFEPVFINSDLESEAKEECDGDKECLFDIATTGNRNIGRAAKNVNDFHRRMSELSPRICNPECVHGHCVQNNTCECDSGYQGPICSEIAVPIPSIMYTPWPPFGVFISWTASSPHTIEKYRLRVFTVSSDDNYNLVKVNELIPQATLSLFPARHGVRYAVWVEARVAGSYGPPGQIMIQL